MTLLDRSYYRVDGESSHSRLKRLREEVCCSAEEQAERLGEHLEFCRARVPMYCDIELRHKSPLEALAGVPVFDKRRFSAATTDAICSVADAPSRVDNTSGTSGQTFRFVVGRRERAIRREHELLANEMLGLQPGERYLQIWGGHEGGSLAHRAMVAAYGRLTGRTLRIVRGSDRASLAGCFDDVRRHAGGVLVTYPSILYGLCLQDELVEPLGAYRSIILTGEAVNYDLFAAFGLRDSLRNRYGSREFGAIALADEGAMHYFASRFFLENDPDRGLLVTDLAKKAMPMLRYPIGDFVAAGFTRANRCEALQRLAVLGRIDGRTFDTLQGRSGTRYVGTFWTLMLRKTVGVEKFQLVQHAGHRLTVNYVGGLAPQEVQDRLRSAMGDDFRFQAVRRDDIPELRNAKQRIVRREDAA